MIAMLLSGCAALLLLERWSRLRAVRLSMVPIPVRRS
jgi:hypothetical protein